MSHRQAQGEQAEIVVGLAGVFGDEAEEAVAAEEEGGDLSGRARFFGENPYDDEEADAFKRELVELRRVARQHMVLLHPFRPKPVAHGGVEVFCARLREAHCPKGVDIGNAAPEFAVDKVTDTAGSQTQRNERCDKIHGFQGADFVFAAEQPHGNDDAQEAAVERHAAFPDFEHFERMVEVV